MEGGNKLEKQEILEEQFGALSTDFWGLGEETERNYADKVAAVIEKVKKENETKKMKR